jgi:hypothetical protein
VIISPFEEDLVLNLKNLEYPLPKNEFDQVSLKLAGSGENLFSI